jgi:peptidyl-prolyl cis-trans isomerase B (cyclophilin B)
VRPLVEVRTVAGRMVIALYNETPLHRDNFLALVRAGAYDSLLFHRVVPGFMVQGGHPDSRHAEPGTALGDGRKEGTLPAEVIPAFCHLRGAVAAVREPDAVNPERRSDGSQFYIVQGRPYTGAELDQVAARNARYGTPVRYTAEQRAAYAKAGGAPHLDGSYTVFGQVVEGLEVLDAIANAPSDGRDRPLRDIRTFMRVME